uniref:Uncharacterized protein n=1 Tax=Eiseniibacteriota bacterium TaxID=2212470 RepID=A0A832IB28_UNCEI
MPYMDFQVRDQLRRHFRSGGAVPFEEFVRTLQHPADGRVEAELDRMIEDIADTHYTVDAEFTANRGSTKQLLTGLVVRVQSYGTRTYRLSVLNHEVTAVEKVL